MSIRSQAPQPWNQPLMDWWLQNGFQKTLFYCGLGKVYLSGLSRVFAGMVILSTQVGSCYPESILHTSVDQRIPCCSTVWKGNHISSMTFLWQLKPDYPHVGDNNIMGSPCHGTGSTWIDREVKRLLPYRYGVGMTGACYAQDGGAMCICNPDTAQIRVQKNRKPGWKCQIYRQLELPGTGGSDLIIRASIW